MYDLKHEEKQQILIFIIVIHIYQITKKIYLTA